MPLHLRAQAADRSMGRPILYVAGGLLLGVGYALLNTQTDDWARGGGLGRSFAMFHSFVDRGIPLLAGALLGLALHWVFLRAQLVRAEAVRAEELRLRLHHVERDQAVWIVAAATLHELKNPLHAMGLLVDELEDVAATGDAAAIREHVHRVRAQMDRTLVPLDALRGLTRRGARTKTIAPVYPTVARIVESLEPFAAEAGVTLRFEGKGDTRAANIDANIDADFVRIILDNLVMNAIEGKGDRTGVRARLVVVRVGQDAEQRRIKIRVSDDGPGMPTKQGETSVFEPLRTDKSSGLGLGLPIARALARSLGGELETTTDASPDAGFTTSFELTLPAAA